MLNNRIINTGFLTVLLISLAACVNSTVLTTVYDRVGSQAAKRFKSYARFDKQQTEQIETLAATFHSWHRTTQLPQYAEFLRRIIADIETNKPLPVESAENWWSTARTFSDEMRACNPFNVSAELLSQMTDAQVQQMASGLRADLNEREDEYRAETDEDRLARRLKNIRKWGIRAGAGFNRKQTQLLRQVLSRQISLGKQRYELRRLWMEELIVLLEQRRQPDFENKVGRHIDQTWNLTANAFPEQWKKNEQLWISFIKDFINLQTDEQRQRFFAKVRSTAATFDKLSANKSEEPAVCLAAG